MADQGTPEDRKKAVDEALQRHQGERAQEDIPDKLRDLAGRLQKLLDRRDKST